MGRQFVHQIQRMICEHAEFQMRLRPFVRTAKGRTRLAAFQSIIEESYPQYIDELKGIADGAGCAFEDLFILHLRGELLPHETKADLAGCSTCFSPGHNGVILGHNEDASLAFCNELFLAHVIIPGETRFTAMCYPGFLPGNAVGWNETGIFHSINITALLNPQPGIGRYFAARSLLEAVSIDDGIQRISRKPQASGFNYTLCDTHHHRVYNVEIAHDQVDVQRLCSPHFHTNHYVYLEAINQYVSPSSSKRLAFGRKMISGISEMKKRNVYRLLSTQMGTTNPIFREAKQLSETATLATCILDTNAKNIDIYTFPGRDRIAVKLSAFDFNSKI